jgi:hypothetical protein
MALGCLMVVGNIFLPVAAGDAPEARPLRWRGGFRNNIAAVVRGRFSDMQTDEARSDVRRNAVRSLTRELAPRDIVLI